MLKLTQIPIMGGARVIRVLLDGEFKEKMFSMGIKEGSIIRVVKEGVSSNLTLYEIDGVLFSLNKDDCEKIIVLKI